METKKEKQAKPIHKWKGFNAWQGKLLALFELLMFSGTSVLICFMRDIPISLRASVIGPVCIFIGFIVAGRVVKRPFSAAIVAGFCGGATLGPIIVEYIHGFWNQVFALLGAECVAWFVLAQLHTIIWPEDEEKKANPVLRR